jgi:glutathione S-transferase
MLKLIYAPGTCALASHIVLEEAGADYEAERISLRDGDQRNPDRLAVNPKGRVPVLITERGVLTENPVIMGYVAQTHPKANLAPNDDSYAFGDMQAFNVFLCATVHPAFAHHFRPSRYVDGEECQAAVKAKAPQALAEHFRLIEDKLADGRSWVHGEAYTTSDPYLFVFQRWLESTGLGRLADYPHVEAHHRRVAARAAVKRVLEAEG